LAKKRRQKVEKKDDYDFKFPEFDEHQYISLELNKAKISLLAFIFALIMVIITYQFYSITHPDARGPMVLGIFSVIALPFLSKFVKIDTNDFDWKNWIGAGAIYVLSWLAIFILVLNPPFSDFIAPEIDEEDVKFTYQQPNNETWIQWDTEPTIPTLTSPIKINMTVKVTDNSGVREDSVKLIIKGPKNFTMKMEKIKDNQYRAMLNNDDQPFKSGRYTYSIEAKDVYGHKSEITQLKFEVF
jgi:hypothetical protein